MKNFHYVSNLSNVMNLVMKINNMLSTCRLIPFGNQPLKKHREDLGTIVSFSKWQLFSFHVFVLSSEVVVASN